MAEIPVLLPKWGMNMREATVIEWLRAEGDRVEEGEAICLVETDKVNAEVLAPAAGVLGELLVGPDEDVAVGDQLATILTDG